MLPMPSPCEARFHGGSPGESCRPESILERDLHAQHTRVTLAVSESLQSGLATANDVNTRKPPNL